MKTIGFNERDLDVWNGLRTVLDYQISASPTDIGLHLGFDYNGASAKVNRSLKKFVNEGILKREKGKYSIKSFNFNIQLRG